MSLKFDFNIYEDSLDNDLINNSFLNFKNTINSKDYGFYFYAQDKSILQDIEELYKKFEHKKNFVLIGIGGSSLGPKAIINAVGKNNLRNFYFIENIDSDYTTKIFEELSSPEDTLFYVVSKSGGTAETTANFIISQNWLLSKGVEEKDFKNYYVFCTDPTSGAMREYVDSNNYFSLSIPSNIGGRFSVQTAVGLFPARFADIDLEKLFEGINFGAQRFLDEKIANNPLIRSSYYLFKLFQKQNIDQTVFMPYSTLLKTMSEWFVQLWGESLGKRKPNGEETGLTPLAAHGATDQHSQMQLFMEGQNNKCLFLIDIDKRTHDFPLNNQLPLSSAQKLSQYSLNDLMKAEFEGTLKALKENKRNYIRITMEELNEYSLGEFIIYFEALTAYTGIYLEIDPFNQPGVEKGKIYAYEYLNSIKVNR